MRSRWHTLVILLALPAAACLPADTRPTPGSLLVTVQPSDAMLHGTPTVDGWALSFGKTLLSVARVDLDGSSCSDYYSPGYGRVFTFDDASAQKLGTFYKLGMCESFGFGIRPPDSDSLLGAGVTEQDKTVMRTAAPDAYMLDPAIAAGVSGSATSGAVTKTFHWVFRERTSTKDCDGVTLASNQALTYSLVFHAEHLFRDSLDENVATLRFAPLAAADADADGEITLEELGAVTLETLTTVNRYVLPDLTTGMIVPKGVVPASLEDWIYLLLLPGALELAGGTKCTNSVRGGGNRGGGGLG